MQCTRDIAEGEIIVSIPAQWLITAQYVAHEHPHLCSMRSQMAHLTALEKLCLFLLVERTCLTQQHRQLPSSSPSSSSSLLLPSGPHHSSCMGNEDSGTMRHDWSGYMESIPQSFSIPMLYFDDTEMELLGRCVLSHDCTTRLHAMRDEFRRGYSRINALVDAHFCAEMKEWLCDETTGALDDDLFRWAFSAVNTRCVCLMKRDPHDGSALSAECDSNVALVPFLDMLNHSASCNVETRFNEQTNAFEILSGEALSRGEQVFISYGPHSNHTLLMDYGFVIPNNPQNTFCFDGAVQHWIDTERCDQLDRNLESVRGAGLWGKFTADLEEGISWGMLTALRLLCMSHEEWKDRDSWQYCFTNDCMISMANEIRAQELIRGLVESLLDQSHRASLSENEEDMSYHMQMIRQVQQEEQAIFRQVLEQCQESLTLLSDAVINEPSRKQRKSQRNQRKSVSKLRRGKGRR